MSSRRSRTRTGGDTEQSSLPPTDPPPPLPHDTERDGGGNPHVEEPNGGPKPDGSQGAGEVNQEAATAAVLNALSNVEVMIRRMLTILSLDGPGGSVSSRSASRTDGELLYK